MAHDRVREALHYERLEGKVQCLACERRCLIPDGETGFCATRRSIGGRLYTLVYGDIASISANPVEKKPFFHFHPGTRALTIGTWSCNFSCPWCQNYDMSKSPRNIGSGRYLSPAEFIELMREYGCQGTSVSFNEPTLLLEYSLDIFDLARAGGYYNTYVTNGYMTERSLDSLVAHGLDAMNIDIKGEAEAVKRFCGADVDIVWRNAVRARELGVWVELTTLVIPGVNDAEDSLRRTARRIKADLGEDVPWHVTGYYPAYRFTRELYVPPTSPAMLVAARDVGVGEGLKFVYIGNVPGHPYENTCCPRCGECLIERHGFSLAAYDVSPDKRCPHCGEAIPIIGEPVRQRGD